MVATDLKGMRALVTGASSGIGTEMARQLAERGANLVVVARRADRLEALAVELRERHKVEVQVEPLDLSAPDAGETLFQHTEGAGRPVDILINNAGLGLQRDLLEEPWERWRNVLAVDVVVLTELTRRFAEPMVARKRGWVLNVASLAGYTPVPGFAIYSAAKTYVRFLTEALAYELRKTGVRLCSLCPGGTETEFLEAAGQKLPPSYKMMMMSAAQCTRVGLDALFAGRRNVLPGVLNKILAFLTSLLPRGLQLAGAASSMAALRPDRKA